MLQFSRWVRRLLAVLFMVSIFPAAAAAQESPGRRSLGEGGSLTMPTYAASAASAADWASTYYALKYYRVREVNPLLTPFQSSPGSLVTMGAMMDAGAFSAWNLTVGRRSPKIAAAGLWGMAIFRSYLAIHNLRNTKKAERR